MEQPNYLIDTNIIIDYLGRKLPVSGMDFMNNVIDAVPNASVISKIEVLGFNASDEHYRILTDFMNDTNLFDLTDEIVDVCISLRRKYKTKLPDAIIAATAIVYDFTLITRNVTDFKNIHGLKIVNAYER